MGDALIDKSDEGRSNTAISLGELYNKRYYPGISEWGNPAE